MKEITFIVYKDEDGGYYARAAEAAIFTQADTLEQLQSMIKDTAECHFEDEADKPELIHVHVNNDGLAKCFKEIDFK